MPGAASSTYREGITEGRTTRFQIDVPDFTVEVPAYSHELIMQEIAPNNQENLLNTRFIPKVGWQPQAKQYWPSESHETGGLDSYVKTLTVPSGISTKPIQRWNSDLTGVPQGSQRASGDLFYQKQVPAGTSWATANLTADQAAHPGAGTDDYVPCDRVAVDTVNHSPDQEIYFRLFTLGANSHSIQNLCYFYFTSIPTYLPGDPSPGTGYYCIKFRGDGIAQLFEYLVDGSYIYRFQFEWMQDSGKQNALRCIMISSDAKLINGKWEGTAIVFRTFGMDGWADLANWLTEGPRKSLQTAKTTVYNILQTEYTAPVLKPIRVEMRRDIRGAFQVSQAVYPTPATLKTYVMNIPFKPHGSEPFRVEWFGYMPAGTSIDVDMYTADDVALTASGAADTNEVTGKKYFNVPATKDRGYYLVFTFTATDVTKKAILQRFRLVRSQTFRENTPTPWDATKLERVSVTGPSADPSTETFGATVHDVLGTSDTLRLRSGMQVKLDVKYDDADPTLFSTLFQGYMLMAKRRRRGRSRKRGAVQDATILTPEVYPKADWGTYNLSMSGHWVRLFEQLSPITFDFSLDPDATKDAGTPTPYKVTDIIRKMFALCGYPANMIDVPDMPLRYFTDGSTPLIIEAFTQLGPMIIQIARDYLGGYIVFDPNATSSGDTTDTHGCWRLILPPTYPFTNLAEFRTSPTYTATPVLANRPAAYPDTLSGSQTVKTTFIRQDTYFDWVEKPEGNMIIASGVGIVPSGIVVTSGVDTLNQMTQVAINYKSAWFADALEQGVPGGPPAPDPADPDYLGRIVPIYYSDPGLNSPAAVNFACRRLYDMCCHARKWVTFDAPVVLITKDADDKQIRPRPLRYGDPVLVDGAQFIVSSCNVDYSTQRGGDRFQLATYELFSVPYTQNYGVVAGRTE